MSAPSDLPADPPADVRFADLALGPRLLVALEDLGYESPTPIQARTIPALLAGRDLIGQAQTGTGKTAAFALPLLERVDAAERTLQVLVLTPTRELAIQVSEAFRGYASKMRDVEILAIYGGQDYGVQLRALKRGPQIIVGTPGRVMDHMERGAIQLDTLTALVLDEADEMLRMGFIDDVEWILARTPPTRQLALFSATMPAEIRRIAHSYLRDPLEIRLETRSAAASTVHQRVWMVQGVHKLDALTRMLEVEPFDAAIVFVRTRNATVEIAEQLLARGFDADALHGEIPQRQRERIIERLRAGDLDILVATDVAARGLDVERVSHVINYDMPYDTEAYVHRIGRTGRAGRAGTAILFAAQRERHMLRAIERSTGRAIELMPLPDQAALSAVRAERFFRLLDDTIAAGGLESRMELIARYRDERGVDPLVIAAALADQMRPPRPREARAPAVQTHEPGPINEPARARRTFQPAPAPDGDVLAPERFSHRDDDRPRSPPTRSGDGARTSRRASGRDAADAFELYRIEVGRDHGVEPRNIVGAIANESGLDAKHIGRIALHEEHSTIELPPGMPKAVFEHLKRVWVSGRQLRISRTVESSSGGFQGRDRPSIDRPSIDRPPIDRPASDRPAGDRPGGSRPAFAKRERPRDNRTPGPKRRPK